MYKPRDLRITHICIYAVGPHLIHKYLLCNVAMRITIKNKYLDCWKAITSKVIAASIAASSYQHDDYPESGRMMCKVKELSHLLRPLYYEDKLLLRHWQTGRTPLIRMGIISCSPPILAELATDPILVKELSGTGLMAVEVHYRRGLDSSRMMCKVKELSHLLRPRSSADQA